MYLAGKRLMSLNNLKNTLSFTDVYLKYGTNLGKSAGSKTSKSKSDALLCEVVLETDFVFFRFNTSNAIDQKGGNGPGGHLAFTLEANYMTPCMNPVSYIAIAKVTTLCVKAI